MFKILILFFFISVCFYGSEIRYKGKYIPIQALSDNDRLRNYIVVYVIYNSFYFASGGRGNNYFLSSCL